MPSKEVRSGGCLCGAVRFEIAVPEPKFNVCHCGMCRKWGAGPFMAVHCEGPAEFADDEGLTWYRSSEWAERGFCAKCGTSLFYRLTADPEAMLIVSSEAFDEADDFELHQHIYVDYKPGRYQFGDARPGLTEAELLAQLGVTPGDL